VDYSSSEGEDEGSLLTGLYMNYNETGSCVLYPKDREYDDQEFYARIAAILAPAAAIVSFCLLFLECCCCNCCIFNYLIHPFIPLGLILAQVCQGLTFLFFGSSTFCGGDLMKEFFLNKAKSCTFAMPGSLYSLVAFVSYFICGVFVLCVQRPDPICCCKNKVEDFVDEEATDVSAAAKKKTSYAPVSASEDGDTDVTETSSTTGAGAVPPNMMMGQQFPMNMQQMQLMQQMMMQRAANPAAQMNQQFPMQNPAMMQQQQQNGQPQYRFVAVPVNQAGQNGDKAAYRDDDDDDDGSGSDFSDENGISDEDD